MPMLPAALLSKSGYAPGQMTYDLRRLRLAGLIRRLDQTHRYVLTPDGIKVPVFYTELHNRLLRPLLAAAQPPAPAELRDELRDIDQHVDDYITRARLGRAASKTAATTAAPSDGCYKQRAVTCAVAT